MAKPGRRRKRASKDAYWEAKLRESEARFRSLTHLSSDWYWEQDADYRFTRIEGRYLDDGDDSLRRGFIGKRRWDGNFAIEGGWEAHRALLDARLPFRDALLWMEMAEGRFRYIRVSGEPVFAPDGAFAGYRGIGRDVTAQKREELLLRLEHRVAQVLAQAEDSASGLKEVIRAVCDSENWACGRYFRLDEAAGLLRYQDGWSVPEPAFQQFMDQSRTLTYGPGEGLFGQVLQHGTAAWSADSRTDPRVREQALAESTGVRGAFIFAALSEGRTIGVLSFGSPKLREPDTRLLATSRVIGSQIGQFLERKRAEESLRESEARFRSLTQLSSDFFWETDEAHRFTQFVHGPNYPEAYLGRAMLGKRPWDIPSEYPDDAGWAAVRGAMDEHLPLRDFEFARRLGDELRYFTVSGEPRFTASGAFDGYRGVGRDSTEMARARERISSLAFTDPLTGLANRTSLAASLEHAVNRARRRASKIALLFIDLDGFKQVNDLHGHDAGDALLAEAARRLRRQLRASDLVARHGGDEFLVMLEDMQDPRTVEIVAKKLLAELGRPYALAGEELDVTGSIGISVLPDDAVDARALLKHADTAMYAAKQAGKNTFRFYSAAAANEAASERNSGTGP